MWPCIIYFEKIVINQFSTCFLISVMLITIKLVACLSTNGEQALNYTIVEQLILTTNIQTTKIKSSFLITYICSKGDSMP